jgi:hypothetical protein
MSLSLLGVLTPSTELFPTNGCCPVSYLHSRYLAMVLRATVSAKQHVTCVCYTCKVLPVYRTLVCLLLMPSNGRNV